MITLADFIADKTIEPGDQRAAEGIGEEKRRQLGCFIVNGGDAGIVTGADISHAEQEGADKQPFQLLVGKGELKGIADTALGLRLRAAVGCLCLPFLVGHF